MKSIEQDIVDRVAREMSANIDRSILKSLGYYADVEFVRSTGTVFGHPYHTVEPRNIEWQDSSKMWDDMVLWCSQMFDCSPANGVWEPHGRWYVNNEKFWFRDEKDLAWFMLRWK